MSKSLRKILGRMEKTARQENYHTVRSPSDTQEENENSKKEPLARIYSGIYTVGISGRRRSLRHSLASGYEETEEASEE